MFDEVDCSIGFRFGHKNRPGLGVTCYLQVEFAHQGNRLQTGLAWSDISALFDASFCLHKCELYEKYNKMKADGKSDEFILMVLPQAKQIIDTMAKMTAVESPKRTSPRKKKKKNPEAFRII